MYSPFRPRQAASRRQTAALKLVEEFAGLDRRLRFGTAVCTDFWLASWGD